ncbi:hypothetical protein FHT44_005106 [Mycolicibacterium sp. BK634]|uniref:hypothetical protein n=1 Tax=Mycolicibacterium sp. BK634 TaxID=2587099 RepID=UPI001617758B|nr:hypothetical protein [Mycolicibacterium sp. BK634]MBB3752594.1 hypothetical protein [Mycolicibacterium sp. BK634]
MSNSEITASVNPRATVGARVVLLDRYGFASYHLGIVTARTVETVTVDWNGAPCHATVPAYLVAVR